jgi:photosystem I subunit 2
MITIVNPPNIPKFGGSTSGWLKSAETEEKYVISWNSEKEEIFEMPTGGTATMLIGGNLIYFARKEQCLALGTQLRKLKINSYGIFRIYPNGDVDFVHPKDGVFPEKVNEGRIQTGKRDFSIGKNTNPSTIKFTEKKTYEV